MTISDEIENALALRNRILESLNEQEEQFISFEAYKQTLIKCMSSEEFTFTFPTFFEFNGEAKQLEKIKENNKFFVINKGKYLQKSKEPRNLQFPINYRCLRKFQKINSPNDEVWYTTTVLNKNEGYFFIIRDDENNTWKGKEIFNEFSNLFSFGFPFQNMHEWLGLANDELVRNPTSHGKDWKYIFNPSAGGKKAFFK